MIILLGFIVLSLHGQPKLYTQIYNWKVKTCLHKQVCDHACLYVMSAGVCVCDVSSIRLNRGSIN